MYLIFKLFCFVWVCLKYKFIAIFLFLGILAIVDMLVDIIVCGGVEMQGLAIKKAPAKKVLDVFVLEEMVFVFYVEEGIDFLVLVSL